MLDMFINADIVICKCKSYYLPMHPCLDLIHCQEPVVALKSLGPLVLDRLAQARCFLLYSHQCFNR